MKSKVATLFKQMAIALAAFVKSKSMALKNKTIAMRTRLIIFRLLLLRNKKLMLSTMSNKMDALMGQGKGGETSSGAIVLFNSANEGAQPSPEHIELAETVEDDEYPDLRHSLFDSDDEEEEDGLVDYSTSSVIDSVRNSREDGSEFNLEDEIDRVADVFIRRFHRQMWLEKQESLKRYQEMLERSVTIEWNACNELFESQK